MGLRASQGALGEKNLPANAGDLREMCIQHLGWEDPPEKGTATRSSILAREIPWTEEPGGLQSVGSQRAGHGSEATEHTHTHERGRCWCRSEPGIRAA